MNEAGSHDFGKDILPGLVQRARVYAYDFANNRIPGDPPNVLRIGATSAASTHITKPTWTPVRHPPPSIFTTVNGASFQELTGSTREVCI